MRIKLSKLVKLIGKETSIDAIVCSLYKYCSNGQLKLLQIMDQCQLRANATLQVRLVRVDNMDFMLKQVTNVTDTEDYRVIMFVSVLCYDYLNYVSVHYR